LKKTALRLAFRGVAELGSFVGGNLAGTLFFYCAVYDYSMPELPEVQMVVDTLGPAIVGRKMVRVDLRRADILLPEGFDLIRQLTGAIISRLQRRGKRIVFRLADGNQFYIHLGMTGRLTMEPPDSPLLPHTHLVIDLGSNLQMRFRDPRRFGGIWWLGSDPSDANMGPEPLTLRASDFAKRLSKTTRAIKNILLDQSVIAGLGNIYVDESLFKAGIHPLSAGDKLSNQQIATLNRAIKFTLKKAIKHRGSTLRDYFDANGNPGGFQKLHSVYDRADLPCRKCKTPIERFVLGGRSTHFCPHCQPA
jgi:formamidopyrimidine-DNA glycosylase